MTRPCECGCGSPAPTVRRNDRSKGHIAGQPYRFIAGHNLRSQRPDYEMRDCGYETPCWIWLKTLNDRGYAMSCDVKSAGRLAHRVYFIRHVGPVPEGLTLDHLCRNRSCVNPAHLEPVTHQENCFRGAQARAALRDDVHPIAAARFAAGFSQAQLARRLGCSRALIALWERGTAPTAHRAAQLQTVLAIDLGHVPEPRHFESVNPPRAA